MKFLAEQRLQILKDWRDNKESYANSLSKLNQTGIQIEVADNVLTNDKKLSRWIESLELAIKK